MMQKVWNVLISWIFMWQTAANRAYRERCVNVSFTFHTYSTAYYEYNNPTHNNCNVASHSHQSEDKMTFFLCWTKRWRCSAKQQQQNRRSHFQRLMILKLILFLWLNAIANIKIVNTNEITGEKWHHSMAQAIEKDACMAHSTL